jgi:hypothetical protein
LDSEANAAPGLCWTCHPARRRPVAAVVLTLFLLLVVAGVQFSFHEPVLTVFSAVVLGLSVAPFYLPAHGTMAKETITIRSVFGTTEKRWDLYRRYEADRHGVLLSPFDRRSRLDRFHGLNLRYDAPDRDRILDFVRRRIEENVREG